MRSKITLFNISAFTLQLLIILLSHSAVAQTQLITTGQGGFENATSSFAANGWSEAQPGNPRQWRVGTTAGSFAGTKAAYLGNAANYNGSGAASVQHFYRDVFIPADATNVNLAFYLRQPTVDPGPYDEFYVYTTTAANTPASGVIPGAGYTLRFRNNATAYASFTAIPAINISDLAGTTVRVVFTFFSDGVSPHANPAVDNVTVSYTPAVTPCTTPAANPTPVTVSTLSSTSLNVNFTPVPSSGFLVIRTATAAAPTSPVNGTLYTPGTTALGGYIESTGTSSNIVSTGLAAGTQYWYWVYAYNLACAGAPFYRTASPGSGTATTLIVKNWVGAGAGGAGTDFNTAGNWSPSGVPGPTHEAVMAITSSGNFIVNFSSASTTIGGLRVTLTGNSRSFLLNAGSQSFTINGPTSGVITAGNTGTFLDFAVGNGGKITYRGNASFSAASNTTLSIIEGYNGGYTTTNGVVEFDGDLTIGANVYTYTAEAIGRVIFDGTGNQTITHNGNQYIILPELLIGNVNTPVVTVSGNIIDGFAPNNNVTIKGTLNLPAANASLSYCLNSFNPGYDLTIDAGGKLLLGGSTDGEGASNFPLDFGTYNFAPTSTVEYYSTADQGIFELPVYGNLTCTNNSVKYINDYLIIDGNLLVNPTATFGCDYAAYLSGNCVNNGIIEGIFADSEFGFYGTGAQTYSGSGIFGTAGAPFTAGGISVFNPSTVTFNAPAYTERINLFTGQVINSNQLTIGTTSFGVIQRGGEATTNAGSLDTYPALNGTPDLYIRYDDALVNTVSGFEIPASTLSYRTFINNSPGVTLNGSDLTVGNDLQLLKGTFNLQANTLHIGNTITKTAGLINGLNGGLRMEGSATQTIPAGIFVNNDLKNLRIANSGPTAPQVSLGGDINLYGKLDFGNVNSKTFHTAGFLTLKSNAAATAEVADITNAGINTNNNITGDAVVERYISYARKWQLLSVPANSTQSIYEAWQDNGSSSVTPTGYGVQITGPGPIAGTGLDKISASASMKYQAGVTNNFTGITQTNTTGSLASNRGYYLFTYGNRSATAGVNNNTPTTLRSRGNLFIGLAGNANEPVPVNITAPFGSKVSVGNPFASAVNFNSVLSGATSIAPIFDVWDPSSGLGSNFGAGIYQSINSIGLITPGGGSIYTAPISSNNLLIQSGQAFFVQSVATPLSPNVIVPFLEQMKATGSRLSSRGGDAFDQVDPATLPLLSTLLFSADNRLQDGNRVMAENSFSNDLDGLDALKMMNDGINFGISKQSRTLIVEARGRFVAGDTIQYYMSNTGSAQYQLRLAVQNIHEPLLRAELVDRFTNSRRPVSLTDSSFIDFTVTADPASRAANRFYLVFSAAAGGPLPVSFVNIAAGRQADRSIRIKWQVENEINIVRYEVERSADGSSFTGLLQTGATGNRNYGATDLSPLGADNFYRIKAIGLAGDITYSAIVKVAPAKEPALIAVTPNPVKNKQLNIRFVEQLPGDYHLQLSNAIGQVVYKGAVTIESGNMIKNIGLPAETATGNYQLSVRNKQGEIVHSQSLLVE